METINIIPSQYTNNSTVPNKVFSFRAISNRLKGKWLEDSFLIECEDAEEYYEDLTDVSNFKNKCEHHTPDVIVNGCLVFELKNWNDTFKITMYKAKTQILSRFLPYWNNTKKYLIISNPRWCKGVKEWLIACGIRIFELGYVVTKELFVNGKAIFDIKNIFEDILGYSHKYSTKMFILYNKYRIGPIQRLSMGKTDRIQTLDKCPTDKNNSKTNRKDRLHVHYNRLKGICGGIKSTIKQMLTRTGNLTIQNICMDVRNILFQIPYIFISKY